MDTLSSGIGQIIPLLLWQASFAKTPSALSHLPSFPYISLNTLKSGTKQQKWQQKGPTLAAECAVPAVYVIPIRAESKWHTIGKLTSVIAKLPLLAEKQLDFFWLTGKNYSGIPTYGRPYGPIGGGGELITPQGRPNKGDPSK